MTWSYSGNPADSLKDAVRFEIGDTNPNDPLLQDEEIQYVLSQHNNHILWSAVKCCEIVMVNLAREVNSTMGRSRVEASQKFKSYELIAKKLRARLISGSAPIAGGLDTALIFSKGMMDNS